jgi:hypothetical protein
MVEELYADGQILNLLFIDHTAIVFPDISIGNLLESRVPVM